MERLLAAVGEEGKEQILSAGEKLIERGRKEGLQKGLQTGRHEERRALLLKLLGTRFGALPAGIVARVEAADLTELERWFERGWCPNPLGDPPALPGRQPKFDISGIPSGCGTHSCASDEVDSGHAQHDTPQFGARSELDSGQERQRPEATEEVDVADLVEAHFPEPL